MVKNDAVARELGQVAWYGWGLELSGLPWGDWAWHGMYAGPMTEEIRERAELMGVIWE